MHEINLSDPMNPANYIDKQVGNLRLEGAPMNWRDEQTGILPSAIMAYLNHRETPNQLTIVIAYLQHHIHAPLWLEKYFRREEMLEEQEIEIRELRALSLTLKTAEDIHKYMDRALALGLDPL